MALAIPMIWRQNKDHLKDRYFCLTNMFGITAQSKNRIHSPKFAINNKAYFHGDDVPVTSVCQKRGMR